MDVDVAALFQRCIRVIITRMAHKREYHKNDHKTIRPPELLWRLLSAKATSTGNTAHRLMVDELWKMVEDLRQEELEGKPSLKTLQEHLIAALLQAEQYQQLAIEINEQIMAMTTGKAPKVKVAKKKAAKKTAVKKKSGATQKK